jgi:hypothetical protein
VTITDSVVPLVVMSEEDSLYRPMKGRRGLDTHDDHHNTTAQYQQPVSLSATDGVIGDDEFS